MATQELMKTTPPCVTGNKPTSSAQWTMVRVAASKLTVIRRRLTMASAIVEAPQR